MAHIGLDLAQWTLGSVTLLGDPAAQSSARRRHVLFQRITMYCASCVYMLMSSCRRLSEKFALYFNEFNCSLGVHNCARQNPHVATSSLSNVGQTLSAEWCQRWSSSVITCAHCHKLAVAHQLEKLNLLPSQRNIDRFGVEIV